MTSRNRDAGQYDDPAKPGRSGAALKRKRAATIVPKTQRALDNLIKCGSGRLTQAVWKTNGKAATNFAI